MLRFRMGEEKWSVSSLTNYKMVRSMAWLDVYKRQGQPRLHEAVLCQLPLAADVHRHFFKSLWT